MRQRGFNLMSLRVDYLNQHVVVVVVVAFRARRRFVLSSERNKKNTCKLDEQRSLSLSLAAVVIRI